ncbi:MAG: hypothetical protein ACJ76N_17825 [Thermoanaerobaculia bacterium]
MDPLDQSGGERTDSTGTMPPVSNIDPNGFQSSSTAASAVGLGLVAASHPGDTLASLLRLGTHPTEVMTAGLSMASLGRVSLFTAGLVLIAIGILLNIASLVIRRQNHYAEVETCEKEIERRARRYADRLQRASTQGSQPTPGYPNRPNG